MYARPTSLDEYFFFNSLVVRLLQFSFLAVLFFQFFYFKFVVLLFGYEKVQCIAYSSILARSLKHVLYERLRAVRAVTDLLVTWKEK